MELQTAVPEAYKANLKTIKTACTDVQAVFKRGSYICEIILPLWKG